MKTLEDTNCFGGEVPKNSNMFFQKMVYRGVKKLGFFGFPESCDVNKTSMFLKCFHDFLVFLKYFGDKYGVYGSIKSENLEVPEII